MKFQNDGLTLRRWWLLGPCIPSRCSCEIEARMSSYQPPVACMHCRSSLMRLARCCFDPVPLARTAWQAGYEGAHSPRCTHFMTMFLACKYDAFGRESAIHPASLGHCFARSPAHLVIVGLDIVGCDLSCFIGCQPNRWRRCTCRLALTSEICFPKPSIKSIVVIIASASGKVVLRFDSCASVLRCCQVQLDVLWITLTV